jgi:hypothetical protein
MNATTKTRFRQLVQDRSARRDHVGFPNIATHTPFIIARIVDFTYLAPNRWLYHWVRAEMPSNDTWGERAFVNRGGWEGTALNVIEGMNTGSYAGPGVSTAGLPGTFSLRPVQGFVMLFCTVSEMGQPTWFFSVPNALDGACDTPLTSDTDFGDFIGGSYLSDDFGTFDAPTIDLDYGTFGVYDGGTFALVDWDFDFSTFALGGSVANYNFGSFN